MKEQNEETHEPPSSEIGEVEEEVHQEEKNSLLSDSKKYEEISHYYEEFYIEIIEDHFETHSSLEMKQRAPTDGCLNYEGVPNNGCLEIYVGDIEIRFKNVSSSKISNKHEK